MLLHIAMLHLFKGYRYLDFIYKKIVSRIVQPITKIRDILEFEYSYVSNKRRVANKRRVWKKYQNLINVD